ncbi:hypothetical protein ACYZUD_30220 [Pseudomonas sp. XS1P51]
MKTEKKRGRNLVLSGRFPDKWGSHWTRIGEQGNWGRYEDLDYGFYLRLNGQAAYSQSVDTVSFTQPQLEQVEYKVSFRYENAGNFPEAKVILKASTEHEILLSTKKRSDSLASWRDYLDDVFTVVLADSDIGLQIHGATGGGSSGLLTTDFDIQIHLPPLKLKSLKLDQREYPFTRSQTDVKAVFG